MLLPLDMSRWHLTVSILGLSDEDVECVAFVQCKAQGTDLYSSVSTEASTWVSPKVIMSVYMLFLLVQKI